MGFEGANDSYTKFVSFMANFVCAYWLEEFLISFCHAIEL